jgi:speckle-type POZ protein
LSSKKPKIDVDTAFVVVPASDMHLHFTQLLQSGEGTDVVFEVSGEKIHAHRCVLAARSAVFRAELFGPMKEGTTTGVIRIDDMEARVFKLMLSFIYSDLMPDDINEEDEEYDDEQDMEEEEEDDDDDDEVTWQHLLVAADRYDLQRLRLMCEQKLWGYINATRVASILELAEQRHCQGLKQACLDFLSFPPNLQQVMAAGGLNHLRSSCPSLLIDLIAKLAYLKPDN